MPVLNPPLEPMEALAVDELPPGSQWQFEPKWDGFRCLVFRLRQDIFLQSKSGQSLARYFPEIVASLQKLDSPDFVIDSEIVVPVDGELSFDALLQRIHPAASRVKKLAAETPAVLIVFDLLAQGRSNLARRKLAERRPLLEDFAKRYFVDDGIKLSPATTDRSIVKRWWKKVGGGLDGIICKRLDLPYQFGTREGMVKVKRHHTVDCVVGGFRYASQGEVVGSLLLGLFDSDGYLNHVGFTSGLSKAERQELTPKLEKLIGGPGFTGQAPGGPGRWSTQRSAQWQPLKTKLVVEVEYDQMTNGRFRHGTRLVRWRPDKAPRQCGYDQLRSSAGKSLQLLTHDG